MNWGRGVQDWITGYCTTMRRNYFGIGRQDFTAFLGKIYGIGDGGVGRPGGLTLL